MHIDREIRVRRMQKKTQINVTRALATYRPAHDDAVAFKRRHVALR
jgi:hypothetical protein